MISAASLAEFWPIVEPSLRRYLRRRGVDGYSAEDLVQCVAERALRSGCAFATSTDLLRWAYVTVRRLRIDESRRRSAEPVAEMPESAADCDIATVVADRLYARDVLHAIRQLSPADQAALLERPPAETTRSEQVRYAGRRFRARARLVRLLGPASIFIGLLRRVLTKPVATTGGVAVAVASVMSLAPLVLPAGPGPGATESRLDEGATGVAVTGTKRDTRLADARPIAYAPTVSRSSHGQARPRPLPSSQPRPIASVGVPGIVDGGVEDEPEQPDDRLLCANGVIPHQVPLPSDDETCVG